MADEAAAEEIAAELEALSFTYPELTGTAAGGLCIDLAPRGARQAFVSARLGLALPERYPAAPATVALRDARGLGDARAAALVRALEAEAGALAGGPALGRLVELCEDLLTEVNAPEGAARPLAPGLLLASAGRSRACSQLRGPWRRGRPACARGSVATWTGVPARPIPRPLHHLPV